MIVDLTTLATATKAQFEGDPSVSGTIKGFVQFAYRKDGELTVTQTQDKGGKSIKIRMSPLPSGEPPYEAEFSGLSFIDVKMIPGRQPGKSWPVNVFSASGMKILQALGPKGPDRGAGYGDTRSVAHVQDPAERESMERMNALKSSAAVLAPAFAKLGELAGIPLEAEQKEKESPFAIASARLGRVYLELTKAGFAFTSSAGKKREEKKDGPAKDDSTPDESKELRNDVGTAKTEFADFPGEAADPFEWLDFYSRVKALLLTLGKSWTEKKIQSQILTMGIAVWGMEPIQKAIENATAAGEDQFWKILSKDNLDRLWLHLESSKKAAGKTSSESEPQS